MAGAQWFTEGIFRSYILRFNKDGLFTECARTKTELSTIMTILAEQQQRSAKWK